ncbi:hypothetical protein NDU88_003074 [Pleurodeles waltl]|uniref:Uncharacterized protein n=1 Tax=Pleurodeles waltl TaxID=8319 RepID=A0AAV7V1B5_PLEWA|nr:hypothetical protein NDU88_003074 [Pleurodeles waltl]
MQSLLQHVVSCQARLVPQPVRPVSSLQDHTVLDTREPGFCSLLLYEISTAKGVHRFLFATPLRGMRRNHRIRNRRFNSIVQIRDENCRKYWW